MLRLMSTTHPRIDPLRGMVSASLSRALCTFCANFLAVFLLDYCIKLGGLICGDVMVLLASAR
jgi:hypothetical protein